VFAAFHFLADGVNAFVHVEHELVKMRAAFALDRTGFEEEIHQHGLAASDIAVDVEALERRQSAFPAREQPAERRGFARQPKLHDALFKPRHHLDDGELCVVTLDPALGDAGGVLRGNGARHCSYRRLTSVDETWRKTRTLGVPAGAIDPATGLPLAPATVTDPDSGLYVLRPPSQKGQNERVVEAFNIDPFLERKISEFRSRRQKEFDHDEFERFRMEVRERELKELQDNIINTVASFKQTDEGGVRATLKFQFHSGASLLVVIGPRDEVEIARKMMIALVTDPNGMRVNGIRTDLIDMPVGDTQPVSVEAIPVKFAKVESAYAAAMSLLTDKRSKVILTDARTKTLIVQATKAEMVALRVAIEQLDQAARQSGSGSSGSGSSGGSGSVPQKDH